MSTPEVQQMPLDPSQKDEGKREYEIYIEAPSDATRKATMEKGVMKKIPYYKLYRFATKLDYLLLILGAIAAVIHGAMLPIFAVLFGELSDALAAPSKDALYDEIVLFIPYFIYIGLASWVTTYMRIAFFQLSAQRQVTKIRNSYLTAMMRQEVGWFDKHGTGELISRISGDTTIIKEGMGEKIGLAIEFYGMFVAGFVVGFVQGWKLTLVLVAITPLLAASGAFVMYAITSLSENGQVAYAAAGSIANETLSAMRTVASFSSQRAAIARYVEKLAIARRLGTKRGFVIGAGLGVTMLLFFCTWALGLWYGSKLTAEGEYTSGRVFAVFFSVIMGAFALGQASPSLEAAGKAQGAAFKLFEVLDRQSSIDPFSEEGIKKDTKMSGKIQFKDVVFSYPTRPGVLVSNHLTFSVKPGQTVALVGESGSGKSSIVSLLQRFYDADKGSVEVDGINIKDYNLNWYRSHLGYVGQEPTLFSGTIASNIAFGKEGITQKDIERAAKMANAHNFIKAFPQGYETEVGERGAKLSGGQKQRIAIARALVNQPSILLLDESTSALDSKSERIVQEALDQIMKNHTSIVIAHRLSTIRDADVIYVIDQGSIIESGTHEQLMKAEGKYATLVMLQGGETAKKQKPKKRSKKSLHEEEEEERDDENAPLTESTNEEPEQTGCCKPKKKKEEVKTVSMARLLSYNKPELGWIIFGVIAAAFNGALQPAYALVYSKMYAILINFQYQASLGIVLSSDEIMADIGPWVIGMAAIGVGAFIFQLIQSGFFGVAGEKLTERLRKLVFEAMLRQQMSWFDEEKNASGSLTSRLSTEAALVESLVGTRLGLAAQNIITIVFCLAIAFWYSWALTLVILATFPLLVLGSYLETESAKGFTANVEKANALANQVASESIASVRTVSAFNAQLVIIERYQAFLQKPFKIATKTAHVSGFLSGLSQFLMYGSYAFDFWVGAEFVRNDIIQDPADFIFVLMSILMAAMSLGQSSSFMPNAAQAQVAAAKIFETIDSVPEIDPFSEKGLKPDSLKGHISFENVSFRYPTRKQQQIFDDLTFEILPSQVMAVVGQSGCGKSTIIQLIERFYDVDSGVVKIDGIDVKEFNLTWLRQQLGLVSQEPILFTGSIASNIRLGKPDATDEEVQKAAKAANAHNFILGFPDGYQTEVGEKGGQLSGGQKQRIAIARAVLKRPKVLLLDEATSALDTESEKIVQKTLDEVMKGRTVAVVAHRLSTIRNADEILVLDSGKIVEQGTHDELVANQGIYFALQARQAKQINMQQ